MRRVHRRHQSGITLVETGIALAIALILLAAALPSFRSLLERRTLEGAATRLATDLRYLRSEAVARNEPLRIGFGASAAGTCYVLYGAERGECKCNVSAAASCTDRAREIGAVSFPAAQGLALHSNVASILFDPVHGSATPGGTLRLVQASGLSVHHVVNLAGRVRSCSPGAAVSGYREC